MRVRRRAQRHYSPILTGEAQGKLAGPAQFLSANQETVFALPEVSQAGELLFSYSSESTAFNQSHTAVMAAGSSSATSASHTESNVVAVARADTATAWGKIPTPVGTTNAGGAVVPATTSDKMIALVLEWLWIAWV